MIFINFFLLGTEVGLMLRFLVREFSFVRLAAVLDIFREIDCLIFCF